MRLSRTRAFLRSGLAASGALSLVGLPVLMAFLPIGPIGAGSGASPSALTIGAAAFAALAAVRLAGAPGPAIQAGDA